MAVLRKPGTPVPVTCHSAGSTRRYVWRYPTGFEGIEISGTLAELGARDRSPLTIYEQMLKALDVIYPEPDDDAVAYRAQVNDQIGRLMVFVEAARNGDYPMDAYTAMTEGDLALEDMVDLLCQARGVPECARLGKLRSDSAVYHMKLGYAVASHLLTEIEPHPEGVAKARRGMRPPRELVDRIPPDDLKAIGWSYAANTRPSEEQKKTSASPPPGSPPPDSSTTESTPPPTTP